MKPNERDETLGNRAVTILERIPLLVAAIVCIAIAAIDLAGFTSWSPITDRIPTLTLLAVGLVSAYLLIERQTIIRKVSSQTNKISNDVRKLSEQVSTSTSFFDALNGDRFSEVKFIYGMREYGSVISATSVTTGSERTFELWTDSLREARKFFAFNYVSSAQVWATKGWALEIANSLQLSRLKHGCIIRRVFIVDDDVELDALKDVMAAQLELGIDVRWVKISDLKKTPTITTAVKEIGSWDFVAIDNELVFSVDLDRGRKMQGATLQKSPSLNALAERCFMEAYGMGQTIDEK